jgi:RNA polymerase sigma-70 factor (ECF subfamily)
MPKAISNDAQDIAAQGPDPGRWLQEYGDALFRYALRRLHNVAQAEDAVQETLLAAFQARASYSGRASEKTWLTGILKHKIIDFIRKQVRESTVDDINAEHCLERLQPAHAQIFSLKELAGQSIDEICKELGITATNCSVMLYRARMGLRRCLEIRWAGNNQEELH